MTESILDGNAVMELVNNTHAAWAAGRHEAVLDDLRRAVPQARRLVPDEPAKYRGLYIGVLCNLEGRLVQAAHRDAEVASVQHELIEALKTAESHASSDGERSEDRRLRMQVMRRLADTQAHLGDLDAALVTAEAARAEAAKTVDVSFDQSTVLADREELGECYVLLSTLLERAGFVTKSIAAINAAIGVESDLVLDDPGRNRLLLAELYGDLGLLLMRAERPAEAEAPLRSATRLYASYFAMDPDSDEVRHNLAEFSTILGRVLGGLGRPDDALEFFEKAIEARRAAPDPDLDAERAELADCLLGLGVCLSDLGRHEAAIIPTKESAAMWRALKRDDSPEYDADDFGMAHELLARDLLKLDRRDEALAVIAQWHALSDGADWPPSRSFQ